MTKAILSIITVLGLCSASFARDADYYKAMRKLVADLSLDKDALQWVIEKNGWSSRS